MSDCFRSIILIGRPAAGKSEIIDFLKHTPPSERRDRFHIGDLVEIDDFPFLWEKFQEDDILPAHLCQVIGYGTANNAATSNNYLCAFR